MLQQSHTRPSSKSALVRVALDWGDKEDVFICPVIDALRLFFELGASVRVVGLAEAPTPHARHPVEGPDRGR